MDIQFRNYRGHEDFEKVSEFLISLYEPQNQDGNWLQPTWEYMYSHPMLDRSSLSKIGIWEDGGKIAAVVHYESTLGEVFFQRSRGYAQLVVEMLDYAEQNLLGIDKHGNQYLRVYVNQGEAAFENLVQEQRYSISPQFNRPLYSFPIPKFFPSTNIPEGFTLKNLAEENDLVKIHRVLWRGFNHPGEPPPEGIAERRQMQSTPNFRKDLTLVAVAPDGNFVSFCGMWHEQTNHIAYVEPVATDPDYRRLGLGKAVVLEGIRRCAAEGATIAFVGSDLPFYQAIGFQPCYNSRCWTKEFN